jgi:secreted trypsin-like serine protease
VRTASGVVVLINHSASEDRLFEGAFCGGILVAPDLVLTAAHCVDQRAARSVDVLTGADDLCTGGYEQRVRVDTMHLGLGENSSLALLRLNDSVALSVASISPAPPDMGGSLVALGWGRGSVAGVPSCSLRSVSLTTIEAGACDASGFDRSSIVCSLPSADLNTCDGDSGGPVVDVSDGRADVVAVTMSGIGCDPDSLGRNELVTETLLMGWISEAATDR